MTASVDGVRPDLVIFDEVHDSDCATHNEPAEPNGPCNCQLYVAQPTMLVAERRPSVICQCARGEGRCDVLVPVTNITHDPKTKQRKVEQIEEACTLWKGHIVTMTAGHRYIQDEENERTGPRVVLADVTGDHLDPGDPGGALYYEGACKRCGQVYRASILMGGRDES